MYEPANIAECMVRMLFLHQVLHFADRMAHRGKTMKVFFQKKSGCKEAVKQLRSIKRQFDAKKAFDIFF